MSALWARRIWLAMTRVLPVRLKYTTSVDEEGS
jgi:hypothetical protein